MRFFRISEPSRSIALTPDSGTLLTESCRDELNSLHTTRISRWASNEDRQELQKKIVLTEEAVKQANEGLVKATSAHNDAAADVQAAQKRLGEISDAEIRLRGELSGKMYKDPETGLPIFPQ